MHRTDPSRWEHSDDYEVSSAGAERSTRIVIGITAMMMVVEIAAGIAFGSMVLLADALTSVTAILALLAGRFFG